ncbi:TonB-dependent receptor plug domain-containing protein [Pseudomonas eucalypticola]|uniref:TonB-dependent receptor n=1 Tax=Pseudomonas eucalypticola TaxID=2599595 RepID=A0A7D5D8K5_9PSED|nr:TonB-dependent receptor [Pseudomonas eucalypticola]QKZ05620.1 TonB-dependent receptor [Pseudomonas eucalypticola]
MKPTGSGLSRTTTLGLLLCAINNPAAALAAQASSDDSTSSADTQLQKVVVTGTRQTGRTVAESLAPIQVISSKELQSSGYSDIGSALSALLPAVTFPRFNQGAAGLQRPFILRGLSPNQVVVLVDGVRYHTSATVNLNSDLARGSAPVDVASIPTSAIDHIEVLTDGASAQYGSDAIAGVVNIILKHGATPGANSIEAEFGKTKEGDGIHRSLAGSYGLDIGTDEHPGWARFSFNAANLDGTNRAQFGDQNAQTAAADGGYAYQNRGDSPETDYQGALNFHYQLSPDITTYGNVILGQREETTYGNYRTQNNSRNIKAIYPNGYLPEQVVTSNDLQTTLGFKGHNAADWDWKTYASYGENEVKLNAWNTLNVSYYNSYGYSPTHFYLGKYTSTDAQVGTEWSKEFKLGFLPNPLSFTWGAGVHREGYKIGAGEPSSYYALNGSAAGAQIRTGTTPDQTGSWSRDSLNTFVDLETDLTDKLSVGLAGRYEDYNEGVGSTSSGKLSLRYQLTNTLALRGTLSNGFRAPSLAQQHYQSINTSIVNQQLTQSGTYAVDSAAARALGAQDLKPEKSNNLSLGLVWSPTQDWDLTVDAYQITIDNQILYSDKILMPTGSALSDYFNGTVPGQQVTAAQFFVNAAKTQTRGIDLVSSHRFDLQEFGKLNLSASANYNKTRVLSINNSNSVLSQYSPSSQLFGPGSQSLLTDATPRTKYSLTADWSYDRWSVMVNQTRYGAVTRSPSSYPYAAGIEPQRYAARWITNASVSYRLGNWTLTAGADNLFDQYPSKVKSSNDQYLRNELPYDTGLSPYGANGAFYYTKLNYTF